MARQAGGTALLHAQDWGYDLVTDRRHTSRLGATQCIAKVPFWRPHLWSVPSPRMKIEACAVAASAIMRLALEMAPSSDAPD